MTTGIDGATSADLIREARRGGGITRRELSLRVGLRREHISRWERGGRPHFDTLIRLIHACGYDLPPDLRRLPG